RGRCLCPATREWPGSKSRTATIVPHDSLNRRPSELLRSSALNLTGVLFPVPARWGTRNIAPVPCVGTQNWNSRYPGTPTKCKNVSTGVLSFAGIEKDSRGREEDVHAAERSQHRCRGNPAQRDRCQQSPALCGRHLGSVVHTTAPRGTGPLLL